MGRSRRAMLNLPAGPKRRGPPGGPMVQKGADQGEMIRWLFENSQDPMHVASASGRFKLVNPAWRRITGIPEAELAGRQSLDFFHPQDVPGIRARAAESPIGEMVETEVRVRTRAGWRWFAARRQRMEDGSHIVSLREITAELA